MTSQRAAYKTELNQRYWGYQKSRFPMWQQFFDRPREPGTRPPVFRIDEAWQNVIIRPNADQPEIDRVLALVPEFDRHKWFRSMNSSQALTQSVLGNLTINGLLSNLIELQDDDGMALFGKAQVLPGNFAMEFKINYLGEPRRTSLDGFVGGDYRVAIECKFTEEEAGTCSRPRLSPTASNYASEHCNSTYSIQRMRKERCSLTEVGVLYWKYIPSLFKWEKDIDLNPCPLKNNYQLVRNILASGVKPDGSVSHNNGHAVLIYDERNPAFQNGGKGLTAYLATQNALHEPTMLRKCSWQRIVRFMRGEDILPWLTLELSQKYGL